MRLERGKGFPPLGTPSLYWLGQAGFWIDTGRHRVIIDPYLSDSLARKYRGRKQPHERMMPPPVTVDELPEPDLVLITHAHTDHLDPDTLGPLHERFNKVPVVVPAAIEHVAQERIGHGARLVAVDAGDRLKLAEGLELSVFPAAHEEREVDEEGRHLFVGYGLRTDNFSLYHSGDSVPFADLDAQIRRFAPQIALLPVNGRDKQRRADGIPGNFTLDEAIHLSRDCAFLVPHHFGMFAFNTIDADLIDAAAGMVTSPDPAIIRPAAGDHIRIVT